MPVCTEERSLHERAGEHGSDVRRGLEDCHMLTHWKEVHEGGKEGEGPEFKFKMVKGCKTALERQVREAIRIERRGTVLNKRGEFSRSKLTRVRVDDAWEKSVWEENWEIREEKIVDEESVRDSNVKRGGQGGREGAKKRKVESAEGVVWGEQVSQEELERRRFLEERTGAKQGTKQARLKFISGKEWVMREILKEVADLAVEVATSLPLRLELGEWEEGENQDTRKEEVLKTVPRVRRSRKEELELMRILEELDRRDYQKKKRMSQKKEKAGLGEINRRTVKPKLPATQETSPALLAFL